jgi:hypothetical protein
MEWLKNTKDFLLIDGRVLAAEIRGKPENERKLWEKGYLWFHDNFEVIIIVGGLVLLALLIYTYFDEKGCELINNKPTNQKTQKKSGQIGGANETPGINLSSNTPTTYIGTGKTKNELRAEAMKKAAEEAKAAAAEKAEKKNKSEGEPSSNKTFSISGQSSNSTENEKDSNQKISIKTSIKNKLGTAAGKASSVWQSVKTGEALELGKEKFADALYNSKDFAQRYAKAGYALAFTVFMVAGFGLFFVPTLIMFIIGGITLAIFNKQKMVFLANT